VVEQQRLTESAEYMVAVILGGETDRTPPKHWTPALCAEFTRLMSTPRGRAGLMGQLRASWQRAAEREQGGRP
jgi:hypothetical protein